MVMVNRRRKKNNITKGKFSQPNILIKEIPRRENQENERKEPINKLIQKGAHVWWEEREMSCFSCSVVGSKYILTKTEMSCNAIMLLGTWK